MVDAAGAIYVIGGEGTTAPYFLQDVWVSTDGGAQPDSVGRGGRGILKGVLRGYFRGTKGELMGH